VTTSINLNVLGCLVPQLRRNCVACQQSLTVSVRATLLLSIVY
jgi:hypothetical protein